MQAPANRQNAVGRNSNRAANGFYKRLMEWLSRKKKSHRRYSEVDHKSSEMQHCCSQESLHGFVAVASAGRNQSAPMIFDISRPARQFNRQRIEENCSSSSSMSSSSISSSSSLSSTLAPPPPQQSNLQLPAVGESRLGFEAPPTTPTSSYNQNGIITTHFDKQEMLLSEADKEIDAEWIIPWSDIHFGQIISQKGSCTINR